MENKPDNTEPRKPGLEQTQSASSQLAIAMELPFTLVGAIVVAGAVGYFLDRWLRTGPWLMIIFGGLGFVGGVKEVLRRLPMRGEGNSDDQGNH